MEFQEKLQELRRRKGITQEELAQALFVSRTAISKWESGRGYPSVDSLKAISKYFSVTIDELISGEKLLDAASEDQDKQYVRFQNTVFGFVDCSMLMVFLLPLFRRITESGAEAVSIAAWNASFYLKTAFCILLSFMVLIGIMTFVLKDADFPTWNRYRRKLSLVPHLMALLLVMINLHPYAAVYLLALLGIKAFILIRKP